MSSDDRERTARNGHAARGFDRFATLLARIAGRSGAFAAAAGFVVLWAASGPILDYSEGWQLLINTGTTIVTFLMVFIIQNSQNRDTSAIQLKLDELIRTTKNARDSLLDLEDMSEEELERVRATFARLASRERDGRMGAKDAADDA